MYRPASRLLSACMSSSSSSSSTVLQSLPIPPDLVVRFGPHTLPSTQLFFLSSLSYATVNLKPFVPGHALCCTRRVVDRVSDLSSSELTDLWLLAQKTGKMLSKHMCCPALNYAIQDGQVAGQTIQHVHIHVIPRFPQDMKHNAVYDYLDNQEAEEKRRQPRTAEQMQNEALMWRQWMADTV